MCFPFLPAHIFGGIIDQETWRMSMSASAFQPCHAEGQPAGQLKLESTVAMHCLQLIRILLSFPLFQQIDGEAFLLMTQTDIVKIMSIKLGPALKIFNSILMFKAAEKNSHNEL